MSHIYSASPSPVEGLAQAGVLASETATLVLGANAIVLVASHSFGDSFGFEPHDLRSKRLADLGQGECAVPQLGALPLATLEGLAAMDTYEKELRLPGRAVRKLRLSARKLDVATGRRRLCCSRLSTTLRRVP